ncbi:MAG: T9SS type A sorting domain-containing protein [Bacteroidota bacterium]|jgi:hypothetical protein
MDASQKPDLRVMYRVRTKTAEGEYFPFSSDLKTYANALDKAGMEISSNIPEYFLRQNYPNPFNPQTSISYGLKVAGNVTIKIYSAIGQEVKTLVDKEEQAGMHSVTWDASGLSSGFYVYRMQSGKYAEIKKMTLLK